jgi:Tol biopolymer transport system component
MSRVAMTHPLAWGWMGPLLLIVIVSGSCENTDPSTGGSTGGLVLVTSTAGVQPDDDGYTIMVDGTAHGSIGPNDSLTVADVNAGSHTVELSDIEFNCATLGQFTRTVSVSADAEALVDYSVACDAVSRSRIALVGAQIGLSPYYEVLLTNADGSGAISLTDSLGAVSPGSWLHPPVSWSADGSRLAFTRSDGGLYATTGDGAGVVRLADSGRSPIMSADGRKVAFLAKAPGPQACCWDIFVAESDGSAVTRLTVGSAQLHYDFAANGSLLVSLDDPTTIRALVFIRPDGTGSWEFAPSGICCYQEPSLSPDGTKVAYYAYPDAQGDNGPGYEIYVSPTDGSGAVIDVSNNPEWDWRPVWSPDGTRIAFVSSASAGSFAAGSLHVVNADGTGEITLTPGDDVYEYAWSPDGTRITYSSSATGVSHVYVANADGSGRTDITPNSEGSEPTWTGQ